MSRSYILNYLHCVFATKSRAHTIKDPDQLWAYMRGIARNRGFELLAVGGTDNHVHVLLKMPSDRNLSEVMRDIKANSSRHLRLSNRLFSWQDGYAGISVSPSQRHTVEHYIAHQEEHHRTRSFEDEYVLLLKMAGAEIVLDEALG